jgi:hypothetical protein
VPSFLVSATKVAHDSSNDGTADQRASAVARGGSAIRPSGQAQIDIGHPRIFIATLALDADPARISLRTLLLAGFEISDLVRLWLFAV